jgi:hypothetical protein
MILVFIAVILNGGCSVYSLLERAEDWMPLLQPAKFCLGRQVEISSLKSRFGTVFWLRFRWIRK